MKACYSSALALLLCAGCRTAPPALPEIRVETNKASRYFRICDTESGARKPDTDTVVWVAAVVQKTADAPQYYPVVFFRWLDAEGVTIEVRSEEEQAFASEGKGVKRRIECLAPDGAASVLLTLEDRGGPSPGKPPKSNAPSNAVIVVP